MSSLLEQLKKKPIPKTKEVFSIDVTSEKEEAKPEVPVDVTVKIIDQTERGFNRSDFLKRLQAKLVVAPILKLPGSEAEEVSKPATTTTVKPKKVKKTSKKLRLKIPEYEKRLSKKITTGTITGTTKKRPLFRRTKKPDLTLVHEGPIESLEISDTIIKDRLPVQDQTIIQAPSYYMNRLLFSDLG